MKGKKGALLLILIILVFIVILWACDLVGEAFGPWGENAALGLIAIILAIGYFKARKESLEEKEKVETDEYTEYDEYGSEFTDGNEERSDGIKQEE